MELEELFAEAGAGVLVVEAVEVGYGGEEGAGNPRMETGVIVGEAEEEDGEDEGDSEGGEEVEGHF